MISCIFALAKFLLCLFCVARKLFVTMMCLLDMLATFAQPSTEKDTNLLFARACTSLADKPTDEHISGVA